MKLHRVAVVAFLWAAAGFAQNQTVPMEKIDAAFSKIDRDHNGVLSLEEAKAFGLTAEAFNVGDQNADGTLDKQEFAAAISYQFAAAKPKSAATLGWGDAQKAGVRNRKIFDGADANHDGTLDVGEYLAAMLAQSQQPASALLKPYQAR